MGLAHRLLRKERAPGLPSSSNFLIATVLDESRLNLRRRAAVRLLLVDPRLLHFHF
jgi:hypothetical protein